jgi:cell division protein FtsZ
VAVAPAAPIFAPELGDEDDAFDLGGTEELAELDLADEDEAEDNADDYTAAAPFELSGMQAGDGYGDEYEDDVDGIVDPLAGLRGAEDSGFGFSDPAATADAGTLDLGEDYARRCRPVGG